MTHNNPEDCIATGIQANLRAIRDRIESAAMAAGRDPGSVRLIAVSKYQPAAGIQQAIAAGQTVFGENTVQEAQTRQTLMSDPRTEWHFIGHLQSNKARFIPGSFSWLHTLDSIKLARKLSASAATAGQNLNLLVQVNISQDPDKHGLAPKSVNAFVGEFLEADLPGVQLRGLMTIGRRAATGSEREADFSGLHNLRDDCASRFGAEYFQELSMGMSSDFETAIHHGATMVRVGTAIFGERPAARP